MNKLTLTNKLLLNLINYFNYISDFSEIYTCIAICNGEYITQKLLCPSDIDGILFYDASIVGSFVDASFEDFIKALYTSIENPNSCTLVVTNRDYVSYNSFESEKDLQAFIFENIDLERWIEFTKSEDYIK